MAQEPSGPPAKAPWTKIFTAFKVALDVKKMALAGAGIVLVALGWWMISCTFYSVRTFPEWKDFEDKERQGPEQVKAQWNHFKAKRGSWNLIHELAGSPSDSRPMDAADAANDLEEYKLLLTLEEAHRKGATRKQILELVKEAPKTPVGQNALNAFDEFLVPPKYKPAGRMRICPWSEERGGNPYLLVAETVKTPGNTVSTGGSLLNWVFSDRVLVLLEPLVKFLMPVVYLFDPRAGFWDRLYLILVIVWTLAIWGFFGGAICRIAAVQVARNERISLREAILFTRERFGSYVFAPLFPMVLLAVFVFVLMIFGWIEWIPWVGDVFAGFFWPVVLLIGFIMAIVMVGLIGWPLMIATISTEGTDSFDALSRSYSYIYQAPWQYLWYNFLALVYGAVLVFFIGFMASLMVVAGKWGVSSAPGLSSTTAESDREPSYLFYYAPTSYGWRDLLISSNAQFVETKKIRAPDGKEIERKEFTPEYEKHIGKMNTFGAILVACWIYPLFLLVIGFSYSFFWSSSTIIYFLMRRHVDDTEMDEVHQDDEDLEDPFQKATTAPAPAPPAAAPSKPGMLSLNVVESPSSPPPPPPPTTFTADHGEKPPDPPPAPPPPENPPPS